MKNVKNLFLLFIFFINFNLAKAKLKEKIGDIGFDNISGNFIEKDNYFRIIEEYYLFGTNQKIDILLEDKNDKVFLLFIKINGKKHCISYLISNNMLIKSYYNFYMFDDNNLKFFLFINYFDYYFNIKKGEEIIVAKELYSGYLQQQLLLKTKNIFAFVPETKIDKSRYYKYGNHFINLESLCRVYVKASLENLKEKISKIKTVPEEKQSNLFEETFRILFIGTGVINFFELLFYCLTKIQKKDEIEKISKVKQKENEKDNNKKEVKSENRKDEKN